LYTLTAELIAIINNQVVLLVTQLIVILILNVKVNLLVTTYKLSLMVFLLVIMFYTKQL